LLGYIARRVLWLIPVLFAASIVTFTLMHLVPGGPWASEKQVAPGVEKQIELQYHLHEPAWQQYGRWVLDVARGDFGPSFKFPNTTINEMVAEGAPVTATLGVMAFVFSFAVGLTLGVVAAVGHNRWPDYVATFISMIGVATPSFVIGIVLVVVFSVWLDVLPPLGWKGPETWIMPILALSGYPIAQIARFTRTSMLEVTRQDYIRTAHSKGLMPRRVVTRHMLRNALIPVMTVAGPILAFMVTGSFIVEHFFGVPGIGRYYVQGIEQRDYGLIMAMTVIFATVVAVLNVVVDVLYGYVDPRIRYS
jgi:oligopeptide transport system permease protein